MSMAFRHARARTHTHIHTHTHTHTHTYTYTYTHTHICIYIYILHFDIWTKKLCASVRYIHSYQKKRFKRLLSDSTSTHTHTHLDPHAVQTHTPTPNAHTSTTHPLFVSIICFELDTTDSLTLCVGIFLKDVFCMGVWVWVWVWILCRSSSSKDPKDLRSSKRKHA